ncbi:hypothetical protein DAERI_100109 [Deinococcus aerius]|uniref:Uncharacterized protein n=1 Tax=Deinococcus aerius TaxID=200253 RepID=A0A2I9D7K2_9DEIO|nr:hypothetical protein [Deinococcus aerius]GBF06746.1 hypothetical protein DAERI_100109 [Deinococcus aerius]
MNTPANEVLGRAWDFLKKAHCELRESDVRVLSGDRLECVEVRRAGVPIAKGCGPDFEKAATLAFLAAAQQVRDEGN